MPSIEETHYEVLGRRGMGWTILQVFKTRAEAVKMAETLWDQKSHTGIRVTKEDFNPYTGEFTSLEIFSRGKIKKPSKYDESSSISPCLSPNDVYGAEGRRSIWYVLEDTFVEWGLTPSELLHNIEQYYRLYNAGSRLQFAIQRTAVTFEEDQGSVQERMRKIERLIQICVDQLKNSESKIPDLSKMRIRDAEELLKDDKRRAYLMMAAISEYIRSTDLIAEKFGRVMGLVSSKRPDWVIRVLDQLIAEQLQHRRLFIHLFKEPKERKNYLLYMLLLLGGCLHPGRQTQLIGEGRPTPQNEVILDNQGTANQDIADALAQSLQEQGEGLGLDESDGLLDAAAHIKNLFEGIEGFDVEFEFSPELVMLDSYFWKGVLPKSSRAILDQLLHEIEQPKAMSNNGFVGNLGAFDSLRKLCGRLDLPANIAEKLQSTIDTRVSRLMNPQMISEYLYEKNGPFDKLHTLIDLGAVCHGAENKRMIANQMLPIFKQPHYEAAFLGLDGNPIEVMPELVRLQARVIESDFNSMHRRKISESLDHFAQLILERSNFLKRLNELKVSPQEKVRKLLNMIIDGYFTEGQAREKAENLAREYMRSPDFLSQLVKQAPKGTNPAIFIKEFHELLQQAGIKRLSGAFAATESKDSANGDG